MKYLLQGQETKRLRFRLLKQEDFDTWMQIFQEDGVPIFLGLDNTLTPKELCDFWFQKIFDRYKDERGGMNVLINKKTNKIVGQCGLLVQMVKGIERLEIGYSILPQFWNKGYASEAAKKCRDHAFENDLADSLISIVHIDNTASEKVAIKNGMTIEIKLDSYKGVPVNIFCIHKNTWKQPNKLTNHK